MGTSEIPKDPKKVVILTNEGTEALLYLGVKPVGAVTGFNGTWYDHTKDELEDVKSVGKESSVNLEAVAALKPDLIIGNKMRHEKIYDQLKAIAPTVFSDTLRGEWKENFKFYSKVLGKEAEGNVILYFTYELGDDRGLSRESEWLNDPLFKSLNVVKNNKAYKVDDTIWNTAGGIKAANLMLDDLTNMLKDGKIWSF